MTPTKKKMRNALVMTAISAFILLLIALSIIVTTWMMEQHKRKTMSLEEEEAPSAKQEALFSRQSMGA